jgi:hypothetical protein
MIHEQVLLDSGIEVDRGIAPLVIALNRIEGVATLDSCEGDSQNEAYVYFRGRPDTMRLVERLADRLRARLNVCCEYRLRLEWLASSQVMGQILTRPDYVETLANALSAINARHTTPFRDGREYRALGSLTGHRGRQRQKRSGGEIQP